MANAVLIEGETGSGKSTATESLDPKTTFIINIGGKPLPYGGWKKKYIPFDIKEKSGNYAPASNPKDISFLMTFVDKNMPHIQSLIIDDWDYMSTFEFMSRLGEKNYDKFNEIAYAIYKTGTLPKEMRDDLVVFFLTKPERYESIDGEVMYRARTIGKLVNEKLSVEGLFTNVLFCKAKKIEGGVKHIFETQTDGQTPAKTPRGMFKEKEIPNDLELVRKTIIAYNE
jgi:hypothetical protein